MFILCSETVDILELDYHLIKTFPVLLHFDFVGCTLIIRYKRMQFIELTKGIAQDFKYYPNRPYSLSFRLQTSIELEY